MKRGFLLMEIGTWVRRLGLERYELAFQENEIDWEALPKLTAEDLKDLGVVLGGHRRRLLDAIAALGKTETPPAPTPTTSAVTSEAERRQLTVMFCDLVGSTPLATRYDPEDLREIVGAYHRCVTDTVARFAGFVAKDMGDGVLIYFGDPELRAATSLARLWGEQGRRAEAARLVRARVWLVHRGLRYRRSEGRRSAPFRVGVSRSSSWI